MRVTWLIIGLLFISTTAIAERIDYEIYDVTKPGMPRLLAKGIRQYAIGDVKVHPYTREGQKIAEKYVELEQGFKIGARIFYEKQLSGFGLLAQRSDADFSWNWYDKENEDQFKKLRGGTLVKVKVAGRPAMEELVEVSFIEDTRLGFKIGRADDHTHVVLVKAGSVLRLK